MGDRGLVGGFGSNPATAGSIFVAHTPKGLLLGRQTEREWLPLHGSPEVFNKEEEKKVLIQ